MLKPAKKSSIAKTSVSKPSKWIVYLLRCRDGSIYCGITKDLKRRIAKHNSGKGAKYIVASRRPAQCVWKKSLKNQSDALKLEYRIKQFPVAKKELLIEKGSKVLKEILQTKI